MTISQDQTAELFRALGRIEQNCTDMRAMIAEDRESRRELSKRVGSLERSRTQQKAWAAGAFAAGGGAFSLIIALYKFISGKP